MIDRREIAPFDMVTGLTYVIAPAKQPLNPRSPLTTWHHGHHPESELLMMGELGRAIRTSRLQLTLGIDHNLGKQSYHNRFYRSYLPKKTIGQMGLLVFAAVNAVPGKVIDMRSQAVRRIRPRERQRLFSSGELCMQSEFSVRRALTRYALQTGLSYMSRAELNLYDNLTTAESKKSNVNEVLGKALPVAFKPLNTRYKEAYDNGYLPESVAPCAAEAVRGLVYTEPDRFKIFDEELQTVLQRAAA
jgi:hypothetical protein